jgi:hypothetical protein
LSLSGNVWSVWSAKSGWQNKRCIPTAKNNDKPTTIDDLARMINAGFTDVTHEIGEVKQDMDEVKQQLGRIENLLLAEQKQRLNELEARTKKLKDALAI